MKNLLSIIGILFVFSLVVWGVVRWQGAKFAQATAESNAKIEQLKTENRNLQTRADELLDQAATYSVQAERYKRVADSIGEIANKPLPCEHELELRRKEVRNVRAALDLCEKQKTLHVARVGLAEMQINNEVKLCGEMTVIQKTECKQKTRRAFFKGAGTGGLIVGILIILAL